MHALVLASVLAWVWANHLVVSILSLLGCLERVVVLIVHRLLLEVGVLVVKHVWAWHMRWELHVQVAVLEDYWLDWVADDDVLDALLRHLLLNLLILAWVLSRHVRQLWHKAVVLHMVVHTMDAIGHSLVVSGGLNLLAFEAVLFQTELGLELPGLGLWVGACVFVVQGLGCCLASGLLLASLFIQLLGSSWVSGQSSTFEVGLLVC